MNSSKTSAEKLQLLYEGKAKKIFSTSDSNQVIMEYKDSLTAFNALKKGSFENKGNLNCQIATLLFKYLKSKGIGSHWIQNLNDNEMLVQKVKIIPLEVVVRNVLAGSTAKKFGIEEGKKLKQPLVEFYFKDDALADPFVSDDQILLLEIATAEQIKELKRQALLINEALLSLYLKVGIQLVDFKVEFGVNTSGTILLADEITPDCSRLWDLKTNEKLDKDRFRRDLGKVAESYLEVYQRLQGVLNG